MRKFVIRNYPLNNLPNSNQNYDYTYTLLHSSANNLHLILSFLPDKDYLSLS